MNPEMQLTSETLEVWARALDSVARSIARLPECPDQDAALTLTNLLLEQLGGYVRIIK